MEEDEELIDIDDYEGSYNDDDYESSYSDDDYDMYSSSYSDGDYKRSYDNDDDYESSYNDDYNEEDETTDNGGASDATIVFDFVVTHTFYCDTATENCAKLSKNAEDSFALSEFTGSADDFFKNLGDEARIAGFDEIAVAAESGDMKAELEEESLILGAAGRLVTGSAFLVTLAALLLLA